MTTRMLVSFASAMFLLAGHAFAQSYVFLSIDVSCPTGAAPSACPTGLSPGEVATQTSARGINAPGHIVGSYVAGGKTRGFLLKNGQYTSLEFPVPGVRATIANGINPRGEIVGQYTVPVHDPGHPPAEDSPLYCPTAASPACIKGFHYYRGTFSTVLFPSTVDEYGVEHKHPGAIAQRITPDGDIYGCLHDDDLGPSMFGAVWTRAGARSLTSNGGQLSDPMAIPMSMNNGATPGGGHTVVGLFSDMFNQQHGHVVRNGMLEAYDPHPDANLSAIWDVNARQQFVGTYRLTGELPGQRHGFLQNPDGSPSVTLDFPGAFSTIAFGINPDGVVVGQYALTNGGALHGFVAIPNE